MIINIQFMKKRWNPENIGGWGLLSQLPKRTTCTKYNTLKVRQLLWRNINNIHNYIEKGFLCVVNLFNVARNTISNSGKGSFKSIDYRFSRVYLLRFSKGQLGPRDIDLNNNNIGRREFGKEKLPKNKRLGLLNI